MIISAYDLINCLLVSFFSMKNCKMGIHLMDSSMAHDSCEHTLKLSFSQVFFWKILSIFNIEIGPLECSKSRHKKCWQNLPGKFVQNFVHGKIVKIVILNDFLVRLQCHQMELQSHQRGYICPQKLRQSDWSNLSTAYVHPNWNKRDWSSWPRFSLWFVLDKLFRGGYLGWFSKFLRIENFLSITKFLTNTH